MKVYLALYKGKRNGKWYKPSVFTARLSDWLIRTFTDGIYSHCEIAVAIGNNKYRCYSSSIRDGGLRVKEMALPSEKWDLIEVKDSVYHSAASLMRSNMPAKYDWLGALGIVIKTRQNNKKWFCSEFCAAALGLREPHQYSPNSLANYLKEQNAASRH